MRSHFVGFLAVLAVMPLMCRCEGEYTTTDLLIEENEMKSLTTLKVTEEMKASTTAGIEVEVTREKEKSTETTEAMPIEGTTLTPYDNSDVIRDVTKTQEPEDKVQIQVQEPMKVNDDVIRDMKKTQELEDKVQVQVQEPMKINEDVIRGLNKTKEAEDEVQIPVHEPMKINKKQNKLTKGLQVKFESSEASQMAGANFFTGLLIWFSAVAFILD